MPPKRLLLQLNSREFVCRSCLLRLQRPTPARWVSVRHSSQAASSQTSTAQAGTRSATPDDRERQRTLRKLGLLKQKDQPRSDNEAKINFFQEGDDGKWIKLASGEEFGARVSDPEGKLSKEMEELEQQIKDAEDGSKLFEALTSEEAPESRDAPRDRNETPKLLERIRNEESVREREELPEYISESGLRSTHQQSVRRLNNALRRVVRQLGDPNIKRHTLNEVWTAYSAARKAMSTQWHTIPEDAWNLLWETFALDSPKNPNRMSHVCTLSRDINEAGFKLNEQRQLLAIEAMFIEGWQREAIENHRRSAATLGANPDTSLEFWQLGLRMYCTIGDLERAKRLKNTILALPGHGESDPRWLIPYIRALIEKSGSVDDAFDEYRQLRSILGESMVIDDYDRIIAFFLRMGHTEQALWIFVEMMSSGSIDLRGMEKLPVTVANPFFIGKWLKRLILSGDFEGAERVLKHMMDKGVSPRPIQVNALIGGLLRSDTATNVAKAEEIAWSMVNSRLQHVNSRKENSKIIFQQSGGGWPRATLETFSLLAENYRQRNIPAKMDELWYAFGLAELSANTFFLNQLLFTTLQRGQGDLVSGLCRELMAAYEIKPDSWTFTALFDALPINLYRRIETDQVPEEIARSRKLFADFLSDADVSADPVDPELAKKIMFTFRLLKDKIGMLVAFRAMRHFCKLTDVQPILMELMIGSTGVAKTARQDKIRHKLLRATKQVESFLRSRREQLVEAGELGQDEEMTPDMLKKETADFMEAVLENQIRDVENVEKLFVEAAVHMGVARAAEAEG